MEVGDVTLLTKYYQELLQKVFDGTTLDGMPSVAEVQQKLSQSDAPSGPDIRRRIIDMLWRQSKGLMDQIFEGGFDLDPGMLKIENTDDPNGMFHSIDHQGISTLTIIPPEKSTIYRDL